MSKKVKIQLAREFRKKLTKSEKIMWEALRNRNFLGLKFRRQHLMEGYLIDFYCHELKLALEIDGLIHLKKVKEDKERQQIIEHFNINFFRVASQEVENDLESVLRKLKIFCESSFHPVNSPHPRPFSHILTSMGEGSNK